MTTEITTIGSVDAIILGERSNKVFLFVHGQGGNKEEAIPFADVAVPKGYQVIGIDLPSDSQTLRHYEKLGLLKPSEVDEWTGYRYYSVGQMQTLNYIRRLKDIGFSLEEILDLKLDSTSDTYFKKGEGFFTPSIELLQQKIAICQQELTRLQKRQSMLKSI